MSSRIKKDLRNLLPEWLLAGALVTLPLWLLGTLGWSIDEIVPIHLLMLAIGTSWLGAGIMGKDVALGILSFSLAHSESRGLLWLEKLRTVLIQVGVILILSSLCLGWLSATTVAKTTGPLPLTWRLDVLVGMSLVVGVASVGGGIFYSLVLRSYQGAFWLTLLSPMAIAVILIFPMILSPVSVVPDGYWTLVVIVILAFGVTLGILGRTRFLRWQDLGAWGGDIWLSTRSSDSASVTRGAPTRRYRPLLGLVRKELWFYQLNLLVAVALLLLYIAGASIYDPATQSPGAAALLASFARALLLVFLPLAIGAISISEERRLKVDQWQRVLPSSMAFQWIVKVGMVYLVTVVSTVIVPLVVDSFFREFWSRFAEGMVAFYWVAIIVPILAATLGLYASSFSNSYLVALGSSVVVFLIGIGTFYLGMVGILSAVQPNGMAFPQLLFVSVLFLLGMPLLLALSYYNYRTFRSFKSLVFSNGSSWMAMFTVAVIATQLIYARAWERFTYRPPNPGVAVVDHEVQPTIISGSWVTVLAPDGSLWTSEHHRAWSLNEDLSSKLMIRIGDAGVWTRAFGTSRNVYMIHRNGSLFRSKKWGRNSLQVEPVIDPDPDLSWSQVVGGLGTAPVIARKSDGSLWQWMENEDDSISELEPYLPNMRWKSITQKFGLYVGVGLDGSMWAWGFTQGYADPVLRHPLVDKISKEVALLFPSSGLPDFQEEEVRRLVDSVAPLLEEQGIDITNLEDSMASARYRSARYKEEKVYTVPYQVGTRSDWQSVRFYGRFPLSVRGGKGAVLNGFLVGTRSDGSIWAPASVAPLSWRKDPGSRLGSSFVELNFDATPIQMEYGQSMTGMELVMLSPTGSLALLPAIRNRLDFTETATRLSERSNWISFERDNFSIIGLSADGLLWHGGPYPMVGNPGKFLPLVVPASRKLRPVFDLNTGETM